MVAWLGGMPQTIAEPFRDFHRNGFDRYDEERKRYARARSAMESAYSNAKKAAAKKNADEVWFTPALRIPWRRPRAGGWDTCCDAGRRPLGSSFFFLLP